MTNSPHQSRMETKFALNRKSASEFVAENPLEPFSSDSRGTYGGEFVAQSLLAAWESMKDKLFQPHSLHAYFLKAGLSESVMRYEVETMSEGRNYCSRLVRCYQLHSNQLCFMLNASFTKNNSATARKEHFAKLSEDNQNHERTKVPFEFLRSPNVIFDKYMNNIDALPQIEHTNSNLVHALPPETFMSNDDGHIEPGRKEFGLFGKVNDDLDNANDGIKARIIDLAFLSDSMFLSTIVRAVNLKMTDRDATKYFRVSLDHTIYFHDVDFDPTEWMFIDYVFARLSNDRVLVTALFFSKEKKLVATVQQEALVYMPMRVVSKTSGGSYKL